jgi:hypothetical protein
MTTAVQTCATPVEPDMFYDPLQHELVVEIQCELTADAEVRTKIVGADQHSLPVLCMEAKPLNSFKRTIHAEQVFSEATRPNAERKAATLKKGARVTLTTTFHDMRTILPHVQAVALHP